MPQDQESTASIHRFFATIARRRGRPERDGSLVRLFTAQEKAKLAGLHLRETRFDRVDLRGANLRGAFFESVSLVACDLRFAVLTDAVFLACDLRRARFEGAFFRDNAFEGSWFIGATGLTAPRKAYVQARGGRFLALVPAALRCVGPV